MAAPNIDGMRYVGDQLHPGGEEAQEHWPAPRTPMFGTGDGHHEDDDDHHHAKKSPLAKLKDKVRKWKHILVKKKNGHDDDDDNDNSGNGTTIKSELDKEEYENGEGDPEYHGTPMYESETIPSPFQGTHANPTLHKKTTAPHLHHPDKESEKKFSFDTKKKPVLHRLDSFKEYSSTPPHAPNARSLSTTGTNKPLTETVVEILAPVSSMVKEMVFDMGVYLKDYLMHMLEPGEEDKVLCQIITKTVREDGEGGQVGVMEKVKQVFSPQLRTEKPVPVSTDRRKVQIEEIINGSS